MAGERRKASESPDKEKAEETVKDIETYAALESVALSDGGKILVESLTTDALADIDSLCGGYKKLSDMELRALCASLEKNLDMVRAIKRAGKQKSLAKAALEEIIGE